MKRNESKKKGVKGATSAKSAKPESGYSIMSGFIAAGNVAEAQSYYSDELPDEEEQGANLALAEYLLSGPPTPNGKQARFVYAMLDKTVRAECHYQALYGADADEELGLDVGGNELVNITAQIVYELDKNLEQMDAHPELRIAILKKVEAALDGFVECYVSDRAFLAIYATCVEKLVKLTTTPGDYKWHLKWLKKNIRVGRLLVATDPECERYLKALAYYLNILGHEKEGKAGRDCYLESLELFQKLAELGLENDELLHDMSCCYDDIGDSYSNNSPSRACEWYIKCLELRVQLIDRDSDNYEKGLFASPINKLLALKGKPDVAFYEKLLAIADKAGDAAPNDTDILLPVNVIVNELLKMTGFNIRDAAHRTWYEIEAKALERAVAIDKDIPRYFWWLADAYSGLAGCHAATSPKQALAYYYKCLDNREKVIAMDGERLCYSCGMKPMLLEINLLIEDHLPDSRVDWYKRWLSITKSCKSLCDQQQIFEHQSDIQELKGKLAKLKKK